MLDDDSALARTARHLFQRAYLLHQRGALADAMRLYKESLAHYPTAEAYTFLAWTYAMMQRYEEAIEACEQAILLDPTFGNPYNDLGAYLMELERWAEAAPWIEKALTATRYDNREFAYFNLGRVHEHFGRYVEAAQCFKAALALNPNYTTARQALRLALGKMN